MEDKLQQPFQDLPESLQDICITSIAQNMSGKPPNIRISRLLSEKLLMKMREVGMVSDVALEFFHTDVTNLSSVSVCGTHISNVGLLHLLHLLKHNLRELDICGCRITKSSIQLISSHSENLESLAIDYKFFHDFGKNEEEDKKYILNATQLQKLCAPNFALFNNSLKMLVEPLTKLTHLDLTGLKGIKELRGFALLLSQHLPRLISLVLFNVLDMNGPDEILKEISSIKTLRHLDVSCNSRGNFTEPDKTLGYLVEKLLNLNSLDISGTNLAGEGQSELCSIPGLHSRVNSPLAFLGLYKTKYDADQRANIPSVKVSGTSSRQQIVEAFIRNMNRPHILVDIMNNIKFMYRNNNESNIDNNDNNIINWSIDFDLILQAMNTYPEHHNVQDYGYKALQSMLECFFICPNHLKKILATIMKRLFSSRKYPVISNQGFQFLLSDCITSSQVVLSYNFERIATTLLEAVLRHSELEMWDPGMDWYHCTSPYTERAILVLINLTENFEQKQRLGEMGGVKNTLVYIEEKLQSSYEASQAAWKFLDILTCENPANCERFVAAGGSNLIIRCKVFPQLYQVLDVMENRLIYCMYVDSTSAIRQ